MTDKPKTYAANDLRNSKAEAFLSAYSGEPVTIRHNRFPGGHFELTYRNSYEPGGRGSAKTATAFANLINDEKMNLTDEQKTALMTSMVLGCENGGIKCTHIEGLPGYVILSQARADLSGQYFRWTNYEMRNGFADTFEECLQKAREHAKCQSK